MEGEEERRRDGIFGGHNEANGPNANFPSSRPKSWFQCCVCCPRTKSPPLPLSLLLSVCGRSRNNLIEKKKISPDVATKESIPLYGNTD